MGTYRDGRVKRREKPRRRPLLPEASEKRLEKQRDVIAFWQLREDGLGHDDIERLCDARMLRRIPGRVLTTTRSPLTIEAQRWSAVIGCGPDARVAGTSALGLVGVREHDAGPFHIVTPGAAMRARPGVRPHRVTDLRDDDRTTVDGYPTTTVARALVDAAAQSTPDELANDLDRAVLLGLYDGTAMDDILAHKPRFAGRPQLEAAIATLDELSGKFLSVFERRTARLVQHSTVIGTLAVNVLAHGYRPDIHAVGTSAIIECDGRDYHRSPAQIVVDAEREERLIALGYSILRLRWADVVYQPELTLARIERFVLEHAAPPAPR